MYYSKLCTRTCLQQWWITQLKGFQCSRALCVEKCRLLEYDLGVIWKGAGGKVIGVSQLDTEGMRMSGVSKLGWII